MHTPAAAPPIENRIKFCDILLMGGAAAGANRGTMGLGFVFAGQCTGIQFSNAVANVAILAFSATGIQVVSTLCKHAIALLS